VLTALCCHFGHTQAAGSILIIVGKKVVTLVQSEISWKQSCLQPYETHMIAEEPFNILCMGPKRDVVVC
jgi:hypothetical protein